MSLSHSPKIITDGLVMYLDAANRRSYPLTGTIWTDLTGNGNNGTLTNGPVYSSDNDGIITYDGVNDFVSVANNILLNPTNTMSVGCWVYFNSACIGQRIIFCGKGDGNSTANTQWWLEKTSSDFIALYCSITSDRTLVSNFAASANTWYYVVGTYDSANMRVYVNGDLRAASGSIVGNITSTSVVLSVGKLGSYGALFLNGSISNFKFYNKALNLNQIKQNFNATRGRFGV